MLSIEKGYKYEVFVKNHIINNLNKEAYLWKDIPEKILIDCKLIHSHNENRLKRKEKLNNNPLIDVGIDILQKDEDNFTFVQCKNGYGTGLRIEDLAGFYMQMFNHTNVNGNVYYTSKLSRNITENAINNRIQYIKLLMNETETKEEVKTVFKSHDYQIEASNKIINYLDNNNDNNNNDKAILSMPCGCGKTYTSYLIANKYDKVVMISPLRQFAKQNLDRYVQYGRTNTLLLDSDGTRDIDQVTEFINNNAKFLISATYKSVDILQQLNLTNCLIIIDEFHNLSKNNVCNEEDDFYKLLQSDNKFLLMSATPRIYELEDDEENDNIDLGEIVYNMTFTEAIEKKYICDYKIWLPSIHEDNSDLINEIGIDDIDNELKAKCMFLFKNLLFHGSKKCILYCQDTNNLNDIKDCIVKLNDFYAIDLNIQEITSETSYKNREKILNVFESSNKIELLLSIRICDECIDIPSCDSIYITYPSSCKIRTIQRLCRCIRTDKNNKFKIGNIFIWCNEYDKILNILSGIKEYDVLFKNKISVLETNFMNKTETDVKVVEDKKLIEKYILDIKEFRQYTWHERLEIVKQYIDVNGKRPSSTDKNIEIQQLGIWLSNIHNNYNNNINIMKNENIRIIWEDFTNEYEQYFLSNETKWLNKLNELVSYLDIYGKKPNNDDIKQWINNNNRAYKNNKYIMKNQFIKEKWEEFINKYSNIFLDNITLWINNIKKVTTFIDNNKTLPKEYDTDKEAKYLAKWIQMQKINNTQNKNILQNPIIKKLWEELINDYQNYFLTNEDVWNDKMNKIVFYIKNNNKKPSRNSKDNNIKSLGQWLHVQDTNYKKNTNIMKNDIIKKKYEQFIEEHREYFLDNITIWNENLNNIKLYINLNKKLPSQHNQDKNIKRLGRWICTQHKNYKKRENIMKNDNLYNDWLQFINEYQEYFK